MIQTDIHKEHEDSYIDAPEICESERRDNAVLAGSPVTVDIKRSVTLVYYFPRLDITCRGSEPYDFCNAIYNRAFPEFFNGNTDKCREVTGLSEFGIIIDLSYSHHDHVFQAFELTLPGPSYAEPERSYSLACEVEVLSDSERYDERVMLGLRTSSGVDAEKLRADFGEKVWAYFTREAQRHIDAGNLVLNDVGHYVLTGDGIMVSDGVMRDLMWEE